MHYANFAIFASVSKDCRSGTVVAEFIVPAHFLHQVNCDLKHRSNRPKLSYMLETIL